MHAGTRTKTANAGHRTGVLPGKAAAPVAGAARQAAGGAGSRPDEMELMPLFPRIFCERGMSMLLLQQEADALLRMKKVQADDRTRTCPAVGEKCAVPLISVHGKGREDFLFDIYRGCTLKITLQVRGREIVPLARLDVGGAPHRNPDRKEIAAPHLHLYREGHDDKWAYPPPSGFPDTENMQELYEWFLLYCNIVKDDILWRSK